MTRQQYITWHFVVKFKFKIQDSLRDPADVVMVYYDETLCSQVGNKVDTIQEFNQPFWL